MLPGSATRSSGWLELGERSAERLDQGGTLSVRAPNRGVAPRPYARGSRSPLTIVFSALPPAGLNDTIPFVLCHVRVANVLFWGADTKVRWAPLFRTRPRV